MPAGEEEIDEGAARIAEVAHAAGEKREADGLGGPDGHERGAVERVRDADGDEGKRRHGEHGGELAVAPEQATERPVYTAATTRKAVVSALPSSRISEEKSETSSERRTSAPASRSSLRGRRAQLDREAGAR